MLMATVIFSIFRCLKHLKLNGNLQIYFEFGCNILPTAKVMENGPWFKLSTKRLANGGIKPVTYEIHKT